jgi:hypothetical protein
MSNLLITSLAAAASSGGTTPSVPSNPIPRNASWGFQSNWNMTSVNTAYPTQVGYPYNTDIADPTTFLQYYHYNYGTVSSPNWGWNLFNNVKTAILDPGRNGYVNITDKVKAGGTPLTTYQFGVPNPSGLSTYADYPLNVGAFFKNYTDKSTIVTTVAYVYPQGMINWSGNGLSVSYYFGYSITDIVTPIFVGYKNLGQMAYSPYYGHFYKAELRYEATTKYNTSGNPNIVILLQWVISDAGWSTAATPSGGLANVLNVYIFRNGGIF